MATQRVAVSDYYLEVKFHGPYGQLADVATRATELGLRVELTGDGPDSAALEVRLMSDAHARTLRAALQRLNEFVESLNGNG